MALLRKISATGVHLRLNVDINSIKTQIQTVAQADFDNTWAVLQTLTGINTRMSKCM